MNLSENIWDLIVWPIYKNNEDYFYAAAFKAFIAQKKFNSDKSTIKNVYQGK